MATEQILVNGQPVTTLQELIRPGLRAVIVGINPGLKSVACGHYWQGSHGIIMWGWLDRYRILHDLRRGCQDDDAFAQGIGMADLIRLPSRSSRDFSSAQTQAAVPDLIERISAAGKVPIVFRYKSLADQVGEHLRRERYDVLRIPSPAGKYMDSPAQQVELMRAIQRRVGIV